ncbi:MAG TPA: aldehyde dehydrogenase family protein, partial [Rhizomicrobium sp.]|nr:aldehyde dehydrogenase family protein [Rhizomicrobium sp.]
AGVPRGVFNLVFGNPAAIADRLTDAPQIKAISFTGSTPVGKLLGARAAQTLKRMTLELGGHAPVLVFDDCDVDAVATAAVTAKFRNSGQVCTSPTRFYVQQSVYERFVSRFAGLARDWRVGDPFDGATQMGPVATARRLDAVEHLSADARKRGIEIAAGGVRLDRPGFYFSPTVLAGAGDDCLAANEEPFGPLALIAPMRDLDEALAKANRLPQALAAYAFTRNTKVVAALREELNAGTIAINHWQASWPETPFGGRGASGFGVEGGVEGLQAFQQIKFVSSSDS